MSSREKRLAYFALAVVFVLVNLGAVKMFYLPKRNGLKAEKEQLQADKEQAENDLASQDEIQDEVEWLAKYEPEAKPAQKAESELEQFATQEATRRRLTVKRRKVQPAIVDSALSYHRARLELEVSGREQDLFGWIDRLDSPSDFRVVTMMRMNPKRDDDTQVDCQVVVEQWFVPVGSEA